METMHPPAPESAQPDLLSTPEDPAPGSVLNWVRTGRRVIPHGRRVGVGYAVRVQQPSLGDLAPAEFRQLRHPETSSYGWA